MSAVVCLTVDLHHRPSILRFDKMDGTSDFEVMPLTLRIITMIRHEAEHKPFLVRWSIDGRVFFIDDDAAFVTEALPAHGFYATTIKSFQEILHIHGFTLLTKGPYASGYMHPQFGRDSTREHMRENRYLGDL